MNDITDWVKAKETLVFLIFALWGGAAHYLSAVRAGQRDFSLVELTGDLTYSGFAGMMGGALAMHFELSHWLTLAICGMAGHMGSRSVFLLERYLKRKWMGEGE